MMVYIHYRERDEMGSYGDLTEAERAHWDEYTALRALTDWPGFSEQMDTAKREARDWLNHRRELIEKMAKGEVEGQPEGWTVANRRARHEFLAPRNLNMGKPKHEVRLPVPGVCTDAEKAYLEAREVYLTFGSQTPEQKARKQANVDWLVKRRQDLWRLMKDDKRTKGREQRYDTLCIATHHGKVYEEWNKEHNKWGVPHRPPEPKTSQRELCVQRALKFVGVHENPAGSNRGNPQPSQWQKRVYGGDGVAWCACFTTCMAWDVGVEGSATASVNINLNMARQGRGMYRAFTTDKSRVRPGDHVVVGCDTCHIEIVRKKPTADGCKTIGGNTSAGPGGSQYNGGQVATRDRTNREIVGYLLVRFDD